MQSPLAAANAALINLYGADHLPVAPAYTTGFHIYIEDAHGAIVTDLGDFFNFSKNISGNANTTIKISQIDGLTFVGGAATNTADYSGITDTGGMTVDLDKGLAWLTANSVSAGPPDLGADTITNFQNVVGTAFNDSIAGNRTNAEFDTFIGSTGNDVYTAGISSNMVDYSKLSMFDASLTATSTGIILSSSGSPSHPTYTIVKGAGGADGTDTASYGVGDFIGTIGKDTFNISSNFIVAAGGKGEDTFNISGGNNATLYGGQWGDTGQFGTTEGNTLDLSALGSGTEATTSQYFAANATGTYHGISEIIMAGGGNLYADDFQYGTGLEHPSRTVLMGGTNNEVDGDFNNGIAKIESDGSVLTSGGAFIPFVTSGGTEIDGAQTVYAPWVLSEKLGYTYQPLNPINLDYSGYAHKLTITLSPTDSYPQYTIANSDSSDGQAADTFVNIHTVQNWIVGSNNGDTYNLTSVGTEPIIWMGSGDDTVNVLQNPDFNPNAADAFHFFYTGGNDTFNGVTQQETIILAPGITPDEVSVAAATGSQYVVDIAGHGSITLNVTADPSLGFGPPRVEFWSDQFNPGVSNNPQTTTFGWQPGPVQPNLVTVFDSFVDTSGAPGSETLTANAGNHYKVFGTPGDKIIQGSASGDDTLIGGTGNDTIIAGAGHDVIDAQFGNDIIRAGAGIEEIHCGWGNSTVFGGSGADTIFTEQGNQTINGGSGAETIVCGRGDNIIRAGTGDVTVYLGTGNNTYGINSVHNSTINNFDESHDTLQYVTAVLPQQISTSRVGEALLLTSSDGGTATVNGFFDNNTGQNQDITVASTVLGPAASATYEVDSTGTLISFILHGASSANTIIGTEGDDHLVGTATKDLIFGLGGNDTLDGGAGADTMAGGTGNDTYFVDNTGDAVMENDGQGTDSVISTISYALSDDVENLTLAGNGDINATGNGAANILTGNDGNNILDGHGGGDTMAGGLGDDTYVVHSAQDIVTENAGAGHDLEQSSVSYALTPNVEDLVLTGTDNINGTGNGLDNHITGNAGDNILDGGLGADAMAGGLGNDTYFVDNAGDVVTENADAGIDTVHASISYTLTANVDNLILSGTENINAIGNDLANTITGNSGNNIIDGGAGDDTIYGGGGNDTLIGGTGNDTVFGGAGNDTFIASNEGSSGPSTTDLFYGYGGHDVYDFTASDFTGTYELTGGTGPHDTSTILLPTFGSDQALYIENDIVISGTQGGFIGVLNDQPVNLNVVLGADNTTVTYFDVSPNTEITGGTGNNTYNGSFEGGNTIFGGTGDDQFFETAGNNIISTGQGNDTVSGGSGNDLYLFSNGDGHDFISDTGGSDTIRFALVDPASVTYTQSGNDLVVHYGTGSDQITILNSYDPSGHKAIENFTFNQPPVTKDDSFAVNEDTVLTGNVLADNGNGADSDPEGDVLSVAAGTFATAHGGVAVINADGDFTYTPAANYNGADSFIYTLMDSVGNTSIGTVNIALAPVNDPPVAKDDNFAVSQNTALTGNVLADNGSGPDYDVDGNPLTVAAATLSTAHGGTVSLQADGSFTYSPAANYTGADSFGYTLLDGQGGTASGTVNIAVSASLNHPPVAQDDSFTAAWGHAVTGNLLADNGHGADTDPDNDALQVVESSVTTANGFTVALAANGAFSFTPPIDFVGSDSFSYTVADGHGGTDTANVTLQVTAPAGAIVGTAGGDNITGTTAANLIFALGGDDTITAGNGNDTVYGGAGNDSIDGGAGNDLMAGGTGADTYVVNSTGDLVVENPNSGTDTILSSISYTLTANVENLTLTGTANIKGTGNALDNVLTGNTGNNALDGGLGSDTMSGGLGNDTYYVDNAGDHVFENANSGTDTVITSLSYTLGANLENLTLTGTANLSATGNDLNNTITGNAGNNIIDGGAGADVMKGGLGNDTYYVDNAGDVISDTGGNDTVITSVSYTLTNNGVENLILADDGDINGGGNNLANVLTGNSHNNILTGSGSVDTIYGMDGNDTLDGGSGADSLIGGNGDDTYVVNSANEALTENHNQGTDTVQSSVNWTLADNFENLTLTGTGNLKGTGNGDDNIIIGNSGNNSLDGGGGHDTLMGGLGDDIYIVNNTGVTIIENAGEGTDTVKSSITYTLGNNLESLTLTGTSAINGTGNELDNVLTGNGAVNTLSGLGGNDTLNGGGANDQLLGGSGNDTLFGNGGVDSLNGGDGNDVLFGQAGADTLTGGLGADTFAFQAPTAFSGVDKITDFSTAQGDKLDISDVLTGFGFDASTMHLSDWMHLTVSGGNTTVSLDRDGLGTGFGFTNIATLTGITNLPDVDTMVANGNLVIHS